MNTNMKELNLNELETACGGNCYELADDSRFLNSLNGLTDRWGAFRMYMDSYDKGTDIQNAWADLGVHLCYNEGTFGANTYKINGQVVSQEQARQYAMDVTSRYMTSKDWKW